jgi:hypothetical protein
MIETYKATIQENGVYIIKNFKLQEATTYRHVKCDLNFFVFTISVKEVKQSSIRYPRFHFEFATRDMLLERETKSYNVQVIKC